MKTDFKDGKLVFRDIDVYNQYDRYNFLEKCVILHCFKTILASTNLKFWL